MACMEKESSLKFGRIHVASKQADHSHIIRSEHRVRNKKEIYMHGNGIELFRGYRVLFISSTKCIKEQSVLEREGKET